MQRQKTRHALLAVLRLGKMPRRLSVKKFAETHEKFRLGHSGDVVENGAPLTSKLDKAIMSPAVCRSDSHIALARLRGRQQEASKPIPTSSQFLDERATSLNESSFHSNNRVFTRLRGGGRAFWMCDYFIH